MYVYKALYKPTIKQQKQCITRCTLQPNIHMFNRRRGAKAVHAKSETVTSTEYICTPPQLHPSPATEDAMTSIHNISDFPAAAAITRARHQRFLSELEANHTNTHEPGAKNTDLDPTEALV